MGDVRFESPYARVKASANRVAEIRSLSDEEVVAALGGASRAKDPLVANFLATEAMNRIARGRRLIETLPHGVIAVDSQGKITLLNHAAERAFGWLREDIVGRDVSEIVTLYDETDRSSPPRITPLLSPLRTGVPIDLRSAHVRTIEGRTLAAGVSAAPLVTNETVTGVLMSFTFQPESDAETASARPVVLEPARPPEPTPSALEPRAAKAVWPSRLAAAAPPIVLGVGLVVLAGWIFGVPILTTWGPDISSTKANAAICFVLIAVGMWAAQHGRRVVSALMCGAVAVVAGVALLEYALGIDFGIDHLFPDPAPSTPFPGRMSIQAAISFLLLAGAVLLAGNGAGAARRAFYACLVSAGLIQFVSILGYAFSAPAFLAAATETTRIALPTIAAFVVLIVGLTASRENGGITRVLLAPGAPGILARALVPVLLAIPAVVWVIFIGERSGRYGSNARGALVSIAITVVLSAGILRTMSAVGASDRARGEAYALLRNERGRLQQKVEGRTRELAESNARMAATIPSLARFAAMVRSSREAIVGRTMDDIITDWNPAAERLFGYEAAEVMGQAFATLLPPSGLAQERAILDTLRRGGVVEGYEAQFVRKDGKIVSVYAAASAITDDMGHVIGAFTIAHDISEKKRAEERFRGLLESAPDAVIIAGADGVIVLANAQAEHMFGYAREDIIGKSVEMLMPSRFKTTHVGHRAGFMREPHTRPMGEGLALYGRRKDGAEFPVEISLSPFGAGDTMLVSAAIRDVTGRKASEERLMDALREKEALLKEVHHRVKNNLQVVSSLLLLQANRAPDDATRDFLVENMSRVKSMALVHEKLYESASLKSIDFRGYVGQLAAEFKQGHDAEQRGIEVDIDIPEVSLDLDTSINYGLVLNELLSNAFKHAFPAGRRGRIGVRLEAEPDGKYTLVVADDGVGIPDEIDIATAQSMGLRLVAGLARQMGGEATIRRGDGAEFRVTMAPGGKSAAAPGGLP